MRSAEVEAARVGRGFVGELAGGIAASNESLQARTRADIERQRVAFEKLDAEIEARLKRTPGQVVPEPQYRDAWQAEIERRSREGASAEMSQRDYEEWKKTVGIAG